LSANSVGRLVLRIFGASSNDIDKRSDAVCTALQVIEHLQDVAEDLGRDRVYLPLDDLARFGVDVEDLAGGSHDPAVRELVSFECDRTRALLDSGRRIVADLSGWGRLAVAGYVGGGYAALEALERSRSDRRRAGRVSRVKHVGAALASGGRVG
jgi:phytoene/squalene synthetase